MTWTKTPDDFPDRMFNLSSDAYRLHHAATTYANRVGTDGHIAKARLSQVPVPPQVRRPAVVRELVQSGEWEESGDGWNLTDFFDSQWTHLEVVLNRRYSAIRQRKRFARDAESKEDISREEEEVKAQLNDAHEARRALQSRRAARKSESQRDSHRESQRPDPPRPAPPQGEGEGDMKTGTNARTAPGTGNGYDPSDPGFRAYLERHRWADQTNDVLLRLAWQFYGEDQRRSPS